MGYTAAVAREKILPNDKPTISLEFFPPKTPPGWDRLFRVIERFREIDPDFVSITYGAGGSTRSQTHEVVRRIKAETDLVTVPHLTCVCHSRPELDSIIDDYFALEVDGVMALGGDPPANGGSCETAYEHAGELVAHIRRKRGDRQAPLIGIAGFPEGHPATPNRVMELDYLKSKVDQGADYICTQLFFDNRDFYDFRERCAIAGISIPIIAGIMTITSRSTFERTPQLALGARYPADLIRRIDALETDDEIEAAGVEWAAHQCRDLLKNGVQGLHLYTLNRLRPVRTLWRSFNELLEVAR